MRKRTIILNLFIAILLLATSNDVFAERTAVRILHYSIEEGRPRPRTEPVICITDKDAGYVELLFRADLGEVGITLTDSTGSVVDEISIATATEKSVTATILVEHLPLIMAPSSPEAEPLGTTNTKLTS